MISKIYTNEKRLNRNKPDDTLHRTPFPLQYVKDLRQICLAGILMILGMGMVTAQDYVITRLTNAEQLSVCKTSPNGGGPTTLTVGFVVDNSANDNSLNYQWAITPITGETVSGSNPPDASGILGYAPYPSGTIASGELVSIVGVELDPNNATGGPWLLTCTFEDGVTTETVEYRLVLDYYPEFDEIIADTSRIQDDKGVICEGNPVRLSLPINNLGLLATSPSYKWTGPTDANFSPANNANGVYVDKTGIYTLEVRNGCGVSSVNMEVVSGIYPTVTADPEPFTACSNSSAVFSVQVSPANLSQYLEFNWNSFSGWPGSTSTNSDGSVTNEFARDLNGSDALDGSSYYVEVNNDGCAILTSSAELSIVPTNPLFVNPSLLEGGERHPNGSISFEKVIQLTEGDNTIIQWGITDAIDMYVLQKTTTNMAGETVIEDITAADATVSGTLTNVGDNSMTIDWTVNIVPDPVKDDIITTELILTNSEDNIANNASDTDFDVMLTAYNVDDEGNSCSTGVTSNTADVLFLPIELLFFEGDAAGEGVLLSWATATELNNDFFTLERSYDGIAFESIGTEPGAGTTFEEQNYTFHDKTVAGADLAYYRLKQTDFDGQFSYSDIISVSLDSNASGLELIQTTTSGQDLVFTYHSGSHEKITAVLLDLNGRPLAQQILSPVKGANNGQFDVARLPRGMYVLQLNNGRNRISERIVR